MDLKIVVDFYRYNPCCKIIIILLKQPILHIISPTILKIGNRALIENKIEVVKYGTGNYSKLIINAVIYVLLQHLQQLQYLYFKNKYLG